MLSDALCSHVVPCLQNVVLTAESHLHDMGLCYDNADLDTQ